MDAAVRLAARYARGSRTGAARRDCASGSVRREGGSVSERSTTAFSPAASRMTILQ